MSSPSTNKTFQPLRWHFHVLALWAFAVAQPLYAKVAENLPFLIAHRVDGAEVVVYALLLLIPVPVVLGLLVWLGFRLSATVGKVLRSVIVFVLGFFIIFPLLANSLGLGEMVAFLVALLVALLMAWAYDTKFWKSLLDILSPAPVLFIVFFLFFSPVKLLVLDRSGPGDGGSQDRLGTPIVVVMLDEFPTYTMLTENGDLDINRLPGFARLLEIGTWYPEATTVAEATIMAVPAALSGILPKGERKQPPVYQSFPENIFEQLSSQRRVWAIENGTRLCRPGRCEPRDMAVMPQDPAVGDFFGLRYRSLIADSVVIWGHMSFPLRARRAWLPDLGAQWQGFAEGPLDGVAETDHDEPHAIRWNQRMLELEAFFEALEWLGPDTFHYLHSLLPHAPWIHLPDGRIYDLSRSESIFGMVPDHANDTGVKHLWYEDDWAAVIGEQRYLLQLQFVDQLVGRILDLLETSPHFDDMMLVVTADHGSAFTAGTSRRALTDDNLAEIMTVPLFIKYPGQRAGAVDRRPAETLDISATIRDVLGLSLDGLDGRSLLADDDRDFLPRLVNDRGEYLEFDPVRYRQLYASALDRLHHRFDLSTDAAFPRLRDYADWYEQPLTEMGFAETTTTQRLELTSSGQWQQINPGGRFLPARLVGQLVEPDDQATTYLATVNGHIAGFGRVYEYPGAAGTLEIMLSPALFQEGSNSVEVYRMTGGDESEPTLALVYADSAGARLERDSTNTWRLRFDHGRTSELGTGPPYGEAHLGHDPDQDLYVLRGWAANPLVGTTAERVHVFVGDELLGSTVPGDRRPDLVERYGRESLLASGFRIPLPLKVDAEASYGIVRVVAVDADGSAAQLPVSGLARSALPFSIDPEFRPTGIPDPAELANDLAVYRVGSWIQPDEQEPGEMSGVEITGAWSGSGPSVRWAGPEFQLCLYLAEATGRFRLEMDVIPFVEAPKVPIQSAMVSIGGKVIGEWKLESRGMTRLEAEFEHRAVEDDSQLCLNFEMPDAAVPADLGTGPDTRQLSMAFRRLRLVRVD